jgi:hypothetical protein
MYSMSPEFINGPVRRAFGYVCAKNNQSGYLSSVCNSGCRVCEYNKLVRKYIFNDELSSYKTWSKDIYPIISKMTLLELKKIMIKIKSVSKSNANTNPKTRDRITELLSCIDMEIEIIKEKELTSVKDQLYTLNDRMNILFDWIDTNNKTN